MSGVLTNTRNGGIILNLDFTSFVSTRFHAGIDVDEQAVFDYIDQYRETQVTDLCININASLSYTPSEVFETCFDKYEKMKKAYEENPEGIDFIADISRKHLESAYRIYTDKGLDIQKIMIERSWENEIRPWISIRMNDLHGSKDPMDPRDSDFRKYAEENNFLRINHRPASGYFDKCLDFNKAEVLNRILTYMGEQLEQYEAGGIELDFLREPFCFRPGEETEGRGVINNLLRKLREKADILSKERNRKIGIMVRVPSEPVNAYDMGFDVYTWAKEELLDVLVVTPRFTTCDSTMPVESWVRIFEDRAIEIAAGLEVFSTSYPGSRDRYTANTVEMATGYAVHYHSVGCNKIYLYNYFDDPSLSDVQPVDTIEFRDKAFELESSGVYGGIYDTSPRAGCYYRNFLSPIGSLETCVGLPRRHVLTFRDTGPIWSKMNPALPIVLSKDSYQYINIKTGKVPERPDTFLLIGASGMANGDDISVWCNCEACSFIRTTKIYPKMTDSTVYVYEILNSVLADFNQVIEIHSESEGIKIEYIEIRIM